MIATMDHIMRLKRCYQQAEEVERMASVLAAKYDCEEFAHIARLESEHMRDIYLDFAAMIYRVADCDIPPELNIDVLINMSDIGLKNRLFLYFGFGKAKK